MALVIRLAPYHEHPRDTLGRTWTGYRAGLTEADVWEAARGVWTLNLARAADERYAIVVAGHSGDGAVLAVYEIDEIMAELVNDSPLKYRLRGHPVPQDHPLRAYTTDPSGSRSRNSIAYVELPEERDQLRGACACGCGQQVRRVFAPGHEQRAIRAALARHFGRSTAEFLTWIDRHGPAAAGFDERNGPELATASPGEGRSEYPGG